MNPNDHYDPDFEARQRAMQAGKAQIGDFVAEQATDPTNYLGLGGGLFGKALGKAAVGTWALLKGDEANATVLGRPAKAAVDRFVELVASAVGKGTPKRLAEMNAFKETGVYQGADGLWRGYISDRGARIDTDALAKLMRAPEGSTAALGDILNHPELHSKLGSVAKTRIGLLPKDASPTLKGQYNTGTGDLQLNRNLKPEEWLNVLLHEQQHKVQNMTGLAKGSNPDRFFPGDRDTARQLVGKVNERVAAQVRAMTGRDMKLAEAFLNRDPATLQMMEITHGKDHVKSILNQIDDLAQFKDKFKLKEEESLKKYLRTYGEAEARMTGQYSNKNLQEIGSLPEDLMSMDPDLRGGQLSLPKTPGGGDYPL